MRAMLFIAVLFTSFLGVAASTPGLLTDTELPKTSTPDIYATEGIGKYTVMLNGVLGSEIYYRINSGEWFHYMKPIVFTEYGSYLFEAYATSDNHSPSDIVSKRFVVDEHTGENLVDPDANNSSYFYYDGFKYKINGSTVSLTRQRDEMCSGDLVIPPSITRNGVTYLVTEVEANALYNTHNITSVQIPSTVTNIGLYAFNWSPKLRSITVDPSNPNYCDIDGVLFNKSKTYLLSYPNAHATEYTIPSSVTMINYSAFEEAFDLVSVTIPNSVTSIRTSAFSCCYSLESVVLPSNLTVFNAGAFHGCKALKSVTFPSSISKIPEWAFEGCSSLESIVIPGTIKTVGYGSFRDCQHLTNVTLSEGVKYIDANAFYSCRALPDITIPSTVTSIESTAFLYCTSLTDYFVDPANTTYCDVDGVLYNKNKTTLLGYPAGNPRLGYDILPTTQTINENAFYSNKAIKRVSIPSGVTTIGNSAFYYCTNLDNVYSFIENPAGISMGTSVFYRNPGNYSERTLHVPVGTVEQYQADTKWSQYFGSFIEITEAAGDVNGDYLVNINDVTALINCLLGNGEIPASADINGDGRVTIADVTALINQLLSEN